MILSLFIATSVVLSINSFITSSVAGFFDSKFNIKQLLTLKFALGVVICIAIFIGLLIGKFFLVLFKDIAIWYASSVFFLLSLKLLYDGIKLYRLRITINPVDTKGLIALSISSSLNALFIGLAFGFMDLQNINLLFALVLLFIGILVGYATGFRLKKLFSIRFELFEALIFFIIAIFIITKM